MRYCNPLLTLAALLLLICNPIQSSSSVLAAATTTTFGVCEPDSSSSSLETSCAKPPALTLENIAEFMDETIPKQMEESHIVGTTLSVVKLSSHGDHDDASLGSWLYGRVFGGEHEGYDDDDFWQYSKGYGMANVESNIGVDPDSSLFRPGSISKMFLWTAVMQLVEQGKIDLDQDICTHLKCEEIPTLTKKNNPKDYAPITMSHLITHTPGFEDYLFNLMVKEEAKLMSLEECISFRTLQRVREPGAELAYSNYGSLLAARIIEVISGLTFEEYIEKNIFEPLGMADSTFRQPLPEDLAAGMAEGYAYNGEGTVKKHFELVNGTPAGGLTSTANDMAKFMKAHLSVNSGGNGLLKPATMKKMHTLLYQPDPQYEMGFAHGLMDMSTNGVRVIGHGGDTLYFHSLLALLPEHKLGVFFSFNTGIENGLPDFPADKIAKSFMDHFFPAPTGKEKRAMMMMKDHNDDSDANITTTTEPHFALDYTGSYNSNRRSESDMLKVNSLAMSYDVKRGKTPGSILVSSFIQPEYTEYVEIDEHLFQEADGQHKLLFLVDEMEDGTRIVRSIFADALPVLQFTKCAWWEQKRFNICIAATGQISILLGFFIWFVVPFLRYIWSKAAALRRGKGAATDDLQQQEETPSMGPPGAKFASRLGSAVVMAYFAFYGSIIYISVVRDLVFGGSLPKWPFFLPYIAFLLGLPLPVMAVAAWRKKYWGVAFRIYYTVFAFAVQGLFWFLWHWGFVAQSLSH
ncbi:unnamed protein product [Cylindrotheca closterium]|uniref:Beta-lactamase-related domain-containing protein n=1 Tax=Cylindrotheca closterium TaxID=2856 RepID=A0AAD2JLJ9_9STRA|nr:unnamed protein product [Cylindrotheca closterium]